MNSLRIAQLHLSPLRVQQGLLVSLIVLVTLLATQQLQHWNQAQEAAAIRQSFISHSSMPSSQIRQPVSVPTPQTNGCRSTDLYRRTFQHSPYSSAGCFDLIELTQQ